MGSGDMPVMLGLRADFFMRGLLIGTYLGGAVAALTFAAIFHVTCR
jgi:hypothetical protein